MSATRAVVPDQPNGKPDWLALIRNSLYIVGVLVAVVFFFSDRMQTPEEKRSDWNDWHAPWEVRIKSIQAAQASHEAIGGHSPMEIRMGVVESSLDDLNTKLDRVIDLLESKR